MSKADVAAKYRIATPADGTDRTIRGFTQANLEAVYRGALRRTAAGLGRPTGPVKQLTADQKARIAARATDVALSIPAGINSAIEKKLAAMPEGLTDAEYEARLKPALAGIHSYNSDKLIPRLKDQTLNDAQNAVYRQNGIQSTWQLTRNSGAESDDACQQLVDQGGLSADDAGGYAVPLHPGCQCSWTVSVDDSTIPDDLMLGADA